MDFTREPIIETIITPREGYKIIVRSSKNINQEEYFVDSVEIVSFGHSLFFRSLERPKPFLVPVTDYEILETREARMVLKSISSDRSIKIGGGKENGRAVRETEKEPAQNATDSRAPAISESQAQPADSTEAGRSEKKRERRRQYRKKRGGREDEKEEGGSVPLAETPSAESVSLINDLTTGMEAEQVATPVTSSLFSSLLQPPPQLISETIGRYRGNELFKSAFFLEEEEQYKPHEKAEELLAGESSQFERIEENKIAEPVEPNEEAKIDIEDQINIEVEPENYPLEGTLPLHADEEEEPDHPSIR